MFICHLLLIPFEYQKYEWEVAVGSPLKLRQLTYFIAVAEELSFRGAAERLFITQPPLSRQIKMLEDSLGVQLFDRDRRGVRLTEAGTRFLMDAQSLVNESEQIRARFSPGQNTVQAEICLGITTVIDAGLFAWVEAVFTQRFPNVRLTVKRKISSQSIRDLNRGHLDVAVIGLPSHAENLTITHLFDDRMIACMASNHSAAKKRIVPILEFEQDKLFWFDRKLNPAYHDHCQKVFDRLGYKPERIPEPADHHVLLGLIASGLGVALVPQSLRSMTRKGVSYTEIREGNQIQISVGAAYREKERSESVLALVALLKEHSAAP
jgi:DNA-binding transcriptional LysR family regulator